MPKFNLELFKTSSFLNFAYIHSKHSFLFQKCQFVYPNKVNWPPIHQFPSFSSFGPYVNVKVQETLKIYLWEKIHLFIMYCY